MTISWVNMALNMGSNGKGAGKGEFAKKRLEFRSPRVFYPTICAYEQDEG